MQGVRRFKVTEHGTIRHKDRVTKQRISLPPGAVFDADRFTLSQLEELERSGYIVPHNQPTVEQDDLRPKDGVVVGQTGKGAEGAHDLNRDGETPLTTVEKIKPADPAPPAPTRTRREAKAPPPAAPAKSPPKFMFDPATLADKTLDQLNVLIQGVDASIPPQGTVEEAVAILSSGFGDE